MLGRKRATAIDVVEAAYREAWTGGSTWLARMLPVAAPLFDLGLGVVAYDYDTSRPVDAWLSRPIVLGGHPSLADAVLATFAATPVEVSKRALERSRPVGTLSE